jgi:thiamine-monophosphate kinase
VSAHYHRVSVRGVGELAAIDALERVLRRGAPPRGVLLGIGDDAAVISLGKERLVFTIDASFEHVHFERGLLSLADVAFRSFAAAVSDLAAMGAEPVAALSALGLSAGTPKSTVVALGRGQAQASRAFGCPLVGGNISRAAELSLTTAVLGRAKRPLRRAGARAGDELWLVGELGLARAGLLLSKRRMRGAPAAALRAFRRPAPRLAEGRALAGRARACIDVSDGLSGDAHHVARASGVRLVIEEVALRSALPAALGRAARLLGSDALQLALVGGEDYALLAAGPRRLRPRFARRIGRVERGSGAVLELASGRLRRLGRGYEH